MADPFPTFTTKDSGARQEFSTGMVRDVQTDKPRYDLVDWPMIGRWAQLMARGAVKYGENNWRKAATVEELNRFKASFIRHAVQYFNGDTDEDHGAACMFNIAGAEMVKGKLEYEAAMQPVRTFTPLVTPIAGVDGEPFGPGHPCSNPSCGCCYPHLSGRI